LQCWLSFDKLINNDLLSPSKCIKCYSRQCSATTTERGPDQEGLRALTGYPLDVYGCPHREPSEPTRSSCDWSSRSDDILTISTGQSDAVCDVTTCAYCCFEMVGDEDDDVTTASEHTIEAGRSSCIPKGSRRSLCKACSLTLLAAIVSGVLIVSTLLVIYLAGTVCLG